MVTSQLISNTDTTIIKFIPNKNISAAVDVYINFIVQDKTHSKSFTSGTP